MLLGVQLGSGPHGSTGGRSAVDRMPGRAAHTYGIAFTGQFAVYAGAVEHPGVSILSK
jgi:hypothetical protein